MTSLNRIASIRIYLWPRTDCGATILSNWLLVHLGTGGPRVLGHRDPLACPGSAQLTRSRDMMVSLVVLEPSEA